MQPMHDVSVLVGLGNKVQGTGLTIDHWGGNDPSFGPLYSSLLRYGRGYGSSACGTIVENAGRPQRSGVTVIGIEGVDAVVHRAHVDHVVHALPGNTHVRQIQRVSDDHTVYRIGKKFSKP